MTVVIAHRIDLSNVILMSDSKLSGPTSTDIGAKIFRLPVNIYDKSQNLKLVFEKTFGIAFSGSSLVATTCHAKIAGCLGDLLVEGADLPTFEDIARFCGRVVHIVIEDIIFKSQDGIKNARKFFTEFIVTGTTDGNTVEVWFLHPRIDDGGFGVEVSSIGYNRDLWVSMGSGQHDFQIMLRWMNANGFGSHGTYGALELMLDLAPNSDVGGGIQYSKSDADGFKIYPVIKANPNKPDEPFEITISGSNVTSLGNVGPASVFHLIHGDMHPSWRARAISKFKRQFRGKTANTAFELMRKNPDKYFK